MQKLYVVQGVIVSICVSKIWLITREWLYFSDHILYDNVNPDNLSPIVWWPIWKQVLEHLYFIFHCVRVPYWACILNWQLESVIHEAGLSELAKRLQILNTDEYTTRFLEAEIEKLKRINLHKIYRSRQIWFDYSSGMLHEVHTF